MDENKPIVYTTYDRILRAWENSMELTRDFEMYAKTIDDNDEVKQLFFDFAEDEGRHASKLREFVKSYQAK